MTGAGTRATAAVTQPGDGRPRVALFLPTLGGGGAERALINLANAMATLGPPVDLVVGNAAGPFQGEIGGRVQLIDCAAPRLLCALPALARYLRLARPAALYPALDEASVTALVARRLARSRVRIYPGIHNTLSQELQVDPGLKRSLVIALARRLYPGADGLVAVSDAVADDAARLLALPRHRFTVIANPVITSGLAAAAAMEVDHPWFRPGEPPVILGCGRLVAQKDFPTLLEAFWRLRRQRPARLLILGEGPDRPALLRLAADLAVGADVALPGFDPNPFRYMARAAVFALSSRHEGSPVVLVQALACGIRVVATDCPGGSRALLDGIASARLVPPGDPAALAQGLAASLADAGAGCRPPAVLLPGFDDRASAAAYLALDAARAGPGDLPSGLASG
jgi:glycosyltransferase involved in cell wall biosynthesis